MTLYWEKIPKVPCSQGPPRELLPKVQSHRYSETTVAMVKAGQATAQAEDRPWHHSCTTGFVDM
jgi:hypothetical protein